MLQRQRGQQRRIAAIAAEDAKRKEEERKLAELEAQRLDAELQEKQHLITLIDLGRQEASGTLSGIANLQKIFENTKSKEMFLATKPLETALLNDNLAVVKFLVSAGEAYPNWQDIVDDGTPVYEFMASIFNKNNSSESKRSGNKYKL